MNEGKQQMNICAAALFVAMPISLAASPVRVMTYNIRYSAGDVDSADNNWPARREALAQLVENERPEVVGFQEVLPDQLTWLRERFPAYEFVGVGRNANGGGEASPVAFLKGRFSVVTNGTFHHEFLGTTSTHGTRVSRNRNNRKTEPLENPLVGGLHGKVGFIQAFCSGVEGVSILHGEFTATHNAVAGTNLVTIFCVNLVQCKGELLVGFQFIPNKCGKGFLGSGAYHQFLVNAVFYTKHSSSHGFPAARLTPQFTWNHHRWLTFQCANGIHFLANNIFHLAEGFQSQGKIGKKAVAQLTNQTGSQHQLMAGNNSLCRHFPQSGN